MAKRQRVTPKRAMEGPPNIKEVMLYYPLKVGRLGEWSLLSSK